MRLDFSSRKHRFGGIGIKVKSRGLGHARQIKSLRLKAAGGSVHPTRTLLCTSLHQHKLDEREIVHPVGFRGSCYQRSLPAYESDAYNFSNATLLVRNNGILCMPEAGTQLTRQNQELTIFHDVAKALTSSLDLDSILQTIMEKMAEYFRPDTWSLLMVDEAREELYFAIAVGDKAEALKNVRLKMGEGIAGWVAKHGEARVVPDVGSDPFFASRVDDATKWETRSVICVPLRSKLRVLGVIQLVNVDMERFREPNCSSAVAVRLRGDCD